MSLKSTNSSYATRTYYLHSNNICPCGADISGEDIITQLPTIRNFALNFAIIQIYCVSSGTLGLKHGDMAAAVIASAMACIAGASACTQ
jgi:hypothetical protein